MTRKEVRQMAVQNQLLQLIRFSKIKTLNDLIINHITSNYGN
jgi:hypothetical protein